jgi:hypothetical protein
LQQKLYFKLSQIGRDEYGWLKPNIIEMCMERMDTVVGTGKEVDVEVTIINANMDEENIAINAILSEYFTNEKFFFTARVDMVSELSVWELKCTSNITIEHFLQTMIYAWLWKVINPLDERTFKIFNIKSGEIYWLEKSSLGDLTPLMVLILKSKYEKLVKKTDSEFLADFQK